MAIQGRLTERSKRKLVLLYIAFVFVLVLNMIAVYYSFLAPFVEDPFLRSDAFWEYWRQHAFWSMWFAVIFVYLNVCLYICSGFILLSPVIGFLADKLRPYLPYRVRRRNWCFCNCSLRNLRKVLINIHDRHCDMSPETAETIDETTSRYIGVVKEECKIKMNCPNVTYKIVGSSAEGLGKPYTRELQKGYIDPATKFFLRFFCFCLPCSTSYSCLRTDFDIILTTENYESKENRSFLTFDCSNPTPSGFLKLIVDINNGWKLFSVEKNGVHYLSSSLIRHSMFNIIDSTSESQLPASRIFGPFKHAPVIELEEKGPAIKLAAYPLGQAWYWNEDQRFVTFEGDFVFGFHCHGSFPKCAKAWPHRPRLWPSNSDVEFISENGFNIVPKPSHDGSVHDDAIEWHFNFSHSEAFLLTKIPKVARACYLAAKMILKNHLAFYTEDFKTYYLKTMFLWELERHTESYWSIGNIEECWTKLQTVLRIKRVRITG